MSTVPRYAMDLLMAAKSALSIFDEAGVGPERRRLAASILHAAVDEFERAMPVVAGVVQEEGGTVDSFKDQQRRREEVDRLCRDGFLRGQA